MEFQDQQGNVMKRSNHGGKGGVAEKNQHKLIRNKETPQELEWKHQEVIT